MKYQCTGLNYCLLPVLVSELFFLQIFTLRLIAETKYRMRNMEFSQSKNVEYWKVYLTIFINFFEIIANICICGVVAYQLDTLFKAFSSYISKCEGPSSGLIKLTKYNVQFLKKKDCVTNILHQQLIYVQVDTAFCNAKSILTDAKDK